jgi:hypothetical protein
VKASCQDDFGCTVTVTSSPGGISLQWDWSIDQTAAYPPGAGLADTLTFTATDTRGRTVVQTRRVFLQGETAPQPVASVEGKLLDADDTRLLYRTPSGTLVLRDRTSGAETTLAASLVTDATIPARLTPGGAVYVHNDHLWSYRDGTVTDLGPGTDFRVAGPYVAWLARVDTLPDDGVFWRRLDTTTGEVLDLKKFEWTHAFSGGDLAENGEAVLVELYYPGRQGGVVNIWRYKNGRMESLYHNDFSTESEYTSFFNIRYVGVKTDGVSEVYTSLTYGVIPPSTFLYPFFSIVAHSPAGDEPLSLIRHIPSVSYFPPPMTYDVVNGWIAYPEWDAQGVQQVWVRSPQGVKKQISSLGTHSWVVALSENGELIYANVGVYHPEGLYTGGMYLLGGFNGAKSVALGTDWDRFLRLSGKWYGIKGGSLFAIDSPPCQTAPKGDVNLDGGRDVADVVELLRIVVGLDAPRNECARAAADTDCDGAVQVSDAVALLHVLVGLPAPACD